MTLRLLNLCGGPLSAVTTAQISSLSMERFEALADTLIRFQDSTDLTSWLAPTADTPRKPARLPPDRCHRQASEPRRH